MSNLKIIGLKDAKALQKIWDDSQLPYNLSIPDGYFGWHAHYISLLLAATQAEVDAGIINDKYVSPLTLANWIGGGGGLTDIDGGTASSIYTPIPGADGGGA